MMYNVQWEEEDYTRRRTLASKGYVLYYIFLLRRRTGERVCVCERTCAYGAHEWAARGHFVRPRVICVLASAHTQPLLGMLL